MKNTLLKFSVTLAAAIFLGQVSAQAAAGVGTLQITVLDEQGQLVQDAPVYIYGEHKTKFVGGKDVPGTTTIEMKPGTYKLSSAIVKKTGDYLDRFASHEAHVRVIEGDNASIILTLRSIQDPMSSISYAELHKIGVPSEIARSFN
jgi:hypothetical protein